FNKLGSSRGIKIENLKRYRRIDNHALKKGDIVVEFNRAPVTSIDSLQRFLGEDTIGKSVMLGILRKGHKQEVRVVPGELVE
ncbi:MAG: PDZ domain-containing protein, partial [Bacteroidales bacterium]|nr:PDZ domain-containing protein [Bacteroidales bacterium]